MSTQRYRTLDLAINESNEQLLEMIRSEGEAVLRTRLMALQLYVSGQCCNYSMIAEQLGVHRRSVRLWFTAYSEAGLEGLLRLAPRGNQPGRLRVFTPEAVAQVVEELNDPKGGFDSYGQVQARFSALMGREVNYAAVHRLVRYGLKAKLKHPRPSHVRKDAERETVIKKSSLVSRILFRKVEKAAAASPYLGMELWACDEVRIGLRTDLGRRITAKGVKPVGAHQQVYQYQYIYGAVQLGTGEQTMMMADALNSTFFEHFLWELANENPMLLKVVLLDNGAFHRAKKIKLPPNIILLFLPPYTPELNPIERLWQEVRRVLKNKVFDRLQDLSQAAVDFLRNISQREVLQTVSYPIYEQMLERYSKFGTLLN